MRFGRSKGIRTSAVGLAVAVTATALSLVWGTGVGLAKEANK